jgi:hypothetical protein
MNTIPRSALCALLLAMTAPVPAVAATSHHGHATVRADGDATVPATPEGDDPIDVPAPTAGDAFCPGDANPDGLDPVDAVITQDPAYAPGDIVDVNVPDAPVDLSGILDFCSDGPTGAAPAVGSLSRALRGLSVPTDSMNVSMPGTITRTLRLSDSQLPKALRPYASLTFGSATKVARSDGFLDLPVSVNAKGRRALRKSNSNVKFVLSTTQVLPTGESRTRTQRVLLQR